MFLFFVFLFFVFLVLVRNVKLRQLGENSDLHAGDALPGLQGGGGLIRLQGREAVQDAGHANRSAVQQLDGLFPEAQAQELPAVCPEIRRGDSEEFEISDFSFQISLSDSSPRETFLMNSCTA